MPYTGFTRLSLPTKKKNNGQLNYRGGVFTARLERSAPPAVAKPRPRGVVGADPGEIKIREAAARKKAFERECFDAGSDGDHGGLDDEVDAKEMEELMFEMGQFESGGRRTSAGGDGGEKDGRKKSFAERMMSLP